MLSTALQNTLNEQAHFSLVPVQLLARRRYQRCFPITALAVPNFTALYQRLNRCLHAPLHVLFTQRRFTTPQSALAGGGDTRRHATGPDVLEYRFRCIGIVKFALITPTRSARTFSESGIWPWHIWWGCGQRKLVLDHYEVSAYHLQPHGA